jgi:hypothetical protein
MSTSASISVFNKDGTVSSIYVHFDGYLDHVGQTLFENYKTLVDAESLMLKGDMSCLGTDVESCEYYVDRGEELHISKFSNPDEFFRCFEQQDYDYLFNGYFWEVSIHGEDWMPLDKALKIEV